MGGSFRPESVAVFTGMGGRFGPEYTIAWEQLKKAKIQNRHITNAGDLRFEHFWQERALLALEELLAYKAT